LQPLSYKIIQDIERRIAEMEPIVGFRLEERISRMQLKSDLWYQASVAVLDELKSRDVIAADSWTDEPSDGLASRVCRVMSDICGWPADKLCPQDSFGVLACDYHGLLTEVHVIMTTEDEFGISLQQAEFDECLNGTLQEFVAFVRSRIRSI
jgi:hypothetical protein